MMMTKMIIVTTTTTRVSVLVMLMMLIMMVGAAELSQRTPKSSRLEEETAQQGRYSERARRGFRLGAADRFSHGFGKRLNAVDEPTLPEKSSGFPVKNDEMVRLLERNPAALLTLVGRYVDRNRDNLVSKSELLDSDVLEPK